MQRILLNNVFSSALKGQLKSLGVCGIVRILIYSLNQKKSGGSPLYIISSQLFFLLCVPTTVRDSATTPRHSAVKVSNIQSTPSMPHPPYLHSVIKQTPSHCAKESLVYPPLLQLQLVRPSIRNIHVEFFLLILK